MRPEVPGDPRDAFERREAPLGEEERADQEHLRDLQKERMVRLGKLLAALAVAVILIIFIIANSQAVPVDFVFFSSRIRLIWVMFFCAVLGGAVGYLIAKPGRRARLHRRAGGKEGTAPPGRT